MSNPSYTYYGTPRTTPDDAPFLRPSPALASSLSVEHRDSASTTPTPYDSFPGAGTPTNSAPLLPPADPNFGEPDPYAIHGARSPAAAKLEQSAYYDADRQARPFWKKPWFWLAAVVAVAVVVVVIVVPVVLVANKHDNNGTGKASSNTASGSGNGNGNSNNSTSDGGGKTGSTPQADVATWGGDGSTVTRDDGTTFTYHNSFGGIWVSDPANPFNSSARPNSWTPALNEKWTWGVDRVWGVNLGGLFVLEPFIVPSLYQSYVGAVDEWTLSQLISAAPNGNLTATLTQHYETFITEDDIAQIVGAGLNFIRLPIPFWAIETWSDVGSLAGEEVGEPFLARVCWGYILRVLGWARKYGLRVNLDLHTVPGSQNGYNHSGKLGMVNFMNGVMGVANAQRTMDYIRVITEFISQVRRRAVWVSGLVCGFVSRVSFGARHGGVITVWDEAKDVCGAQRAGRGVACAMRSAVFLLADPGPASSFY
ncbi:hypothetical protein EIP86_010031 [Pleurotus ostreatoroseus]|nr:hypothetical protein EIP86_010031 [Pleurotus ostreatoroseus]